MSADTEFVQHPADTPWHRLQNVGETPDGAWMTGGPAKAYESVAMRPLEPFLIPEKPRGGEADPSTCRSCRPSEFTIWQDEHWRIDGGWETGGLPFIGAIQPREHWLLEDAPVDVLAGLGPLMQRISEAVKTIPSVARCHFSRWNDGAAHLHLWAFARPEGMMQGRGAVLSYWDGMLTEMPEQMMHEHIEIVAEALAAGGGQAFPNR
ncbi:hypothetical protein [uncultured Microbacterium sp.]|uniref:hypothetical protein n=1 Tax=uncultured Microbacterium sp. TaxID=191216 RepID=UPI00262FF7E6|nr:hypothetical protein [uncultured Microbacterium sp.]